MVLMELFPVERSIFSILPAYPFMSLLLLEQAPDELVLLGLRLLVLDGAHRAELDACGVASAEVALERHVLHAHHAERARLDASAARGALALLDSDDAVLVLDRLDRALQHAALLAARHAVRAHSWEVGLDIPPVDLQPRVAVV